MTLNDYITYWQNLVASHKHIKDFYRLNTNEIDDALRNKVKYPLFQLYDYDGEIQQFEDKADRFADVQKCAFVLYDKVKPGDYTDEHTKISNLKKWGLGLLAKMYQDEITGFTQCPLFPFMLDKNSIKYYITEFNGEHSRGVLFEFDLIDYNFEFIPDPNDFE